MTRLRSSQFIFWSLVGVTSPVWGHPGHGTTGSDEIAHYTTEPVHALAIAVAILGLAAIAYRIGMQKRADGPSHPPSEIRSK